MMNSRQSIISYLASFLVIFITACGGGGGTSPPPAPTNTAPVAQSQSVALEVNMSLSITLLATDTNGDSLTYSISTTPENGSLSGTAPNVTYTPNEDYIGTDSFTFIANDGTVNSATATVSIEVTAAPNSAPIAQAQSLSLVENTSIDVTLLATDADDDGLTYSISSSPSNGNLSGTAPNLTYAPNADFVGEDSFTFTANDGSVDSAEATINISITQEPNNVPTADPQSLSSEANTDLAIALTGSDVDGDSLSYTVVSQPNNGVLSGAAPDLTYTPDVDFAGNDSFTFTVNDGQATSTSATIDISISDTVANAFSFDDLAEVIPGSENLSNTILITGISVPVTVTINAGEFSINGGDFTNVESTVSNNQSIVVRLTASNVALETVEATLTVGSLQGTFSIVTSGDVTAPTASIAFPPAASLTPSAFVSVSGTTDDDGTVASVTVNGNDAISDDDFVNWTVQVPLQAGINNLSVIATDLGGNTSELAEIVIESRNLYQDKRLIQFNNSTQSLIFYDGSERALIGFDSSTSLYDTISDANTPDNQNRYQILRDLDINESTQTAYMIDGYSLDKVMTTDLVTGSRTTITEDFIDVAAHSLVIPHQIILDPELNIAYVWDATPSGQGREAIIKFDLTTGAASVLSDNSFPSEGFSGFTWPDSIALDKENNRILLADTFGSNRIIAVDLDTGARSLMWNTDNTISMPAPKIITMDTVNNQAIVYDSSRLIGIALDTGMATLITDGLTLSLGTFASADSVFDDSGINPRIFVVLGGSTVYQIDLVTGEQSVFTNATTPDAINPIGNAKGVSIDATNNRLLVTDATNGAIVAVDLDTAERTIVSDSTMPNSDNALVIPIDVASLANGQAYVIDAGSLALLNVDLQDGARTILSDNTTIDEFNTFTSLRAMALDAENDRTLVLDSGRQSLIGVDNVTGDRTVISDLITPNADNPITLPVGLLLESGRGLVSDIFNNTILSIDLTSGARTVFSGPGVPDEVNNFQRLGKMVLDTVNNRLLIIDNDQVLTVSLADGSREILSSNSIPDSANPLTSLADITFDAQNEQLLVLDSYLQVVYAIDLITGARTPYMGGTPNGQSVFVIPNAIEYDQDSDRLIMSTGGREDAIGISVVNPNNGTRFSPSYIMSYVRDVKIGVLNGEKKIYAITSGSLHELDVDIPSMTIISNSNVPDNVNPFSTIVGLDVDFEDGIAYVAELSNTNKQILAVDLTDGARTIVSSNTFPDDVNPFVSNIALIVDKDNGRLLVLDSGLDAIIAVDTTTGERTIFSAEGLPVSDFNFSNPSDMILDKANNRVLVLDSNYQAVIVGIDLTTGIRTRLTNTTSNITQLMGSSSRKIALGANPNHLYVTDWDNGLLVLDMLTGEQVILSK